jgi:phosphate transport system permease protein
VPESARATSAPALAQRLRGRVRPRARASAHTPRDRAFRALTGAFAAGLLALAVVVLWELGTGAAPALGKFGLGFFAGSQWDPVNDAYGALPFIAGTLLTSAMALLIAVPISLGIAILLAELAPEWLRTPLSFLVELLAAIPSVVYGLWGVVVLAPVMRDAIDPAIKASPLGLTPFFQDPGLGVSMLTASVVLAIMVIPIVAAISREVLLAVPVNQREAALALGLTRWEAIRHAVLSYGRAGIFGAAVLGLGRALGETMAVTMLIGNRPQITLDFFQSAYTMSAVIANEFGEAVQGSLQQSSLVAVGLALFLLSLAVNVGARALVRRMQHAGGGSI